MADKSCKTCEYGFHNSCLKLRCIDCPMGGEFETCKCNDVMDEENCPHYKKYELKGSEQNGT